MPAAAASRGHGPTRLEEVSLIGADIPELRIADYRFPMTIYEGTGMGMLPWWQRALVPFFQERLLFDPASRRERVRRLRYLP